MVMIMIIIIQSAIVDTYKDISDHCSNVCNISSCEIIA